MAYVKEQFKDLDVMNNYLFNKLTTKKETADKFCRLLLRELIGKELGRIIIRSESVILPDNPEKRGVRLDVKIDEISNDETITNIYDVEPHRDIETDYPKRTRYRQAQLDKDSMFSGDDNFNHMPELYIINITNYDPFGYDQMVYTIENQCVEVPELEYNDDVKIYYFNTVGTKGGSSELKIFLNYLEESTTVNAVNEATKEVAEYVNYLKDDKALEGDYMTVGDWIDRIVKDAVEEAVAEAVAETVAKKDTEINQKNAEIERMRKLLKEHNIIVNE